MPTKKKTVTVKKSPVKKTVQKISLKRNASAFKIYHPVVAFALLVAILLPVLFVVRVVAYNLPSILRSYKFDRLSKVSEVYLGEPASYIGKAMQIWGDGNAIINFPANTAPFCMAHTIESWIKIPNESVHEKRVILNKNELLVYLTPDDKITYVDQRYNSSGTITSVVSLQRNTWNHFAAESRFGTDTPDSEKGLYIFINGKKNAFKQLAKQGTSCTYFAANIGAEGDQYIGYQNRFSGILDEMRISDNVRYTADFTPSTYPFSNDSTTRALYHFDGDVRDSSVNNYHGTVVGNVYYIDSTIMTPPPTPIPDLGVGINPNPAKITVQPYVLTKVFDLVATQDTNYQIWGYTPDNSLTSIEVSPGSGFIGASLTTAVSLRVGQSTTPKIYQAIVVVKNTTTNQQINIPTEITVIPPTATPTPVATPAPVPTPVSGVDCTSKFSSWRIDSVTPTYSSDGKVALKVKGSFPSSAYCLPLASSFASMVNASSGLVTSYWRSDTYTQYTSDTEIALKPFYKFVNGQYYFYVHMCKGIKGLNDDCTEFQLVRSAVTITNPTPIPVPTAIATPLPTPVPVVNHNPVIKTTWIRSAQIGREYYEILEGYDQDKGDVVSMTVSGLPAGITLNACAKTSAADGVRIYCKISGRSTKIGSYKLQVRMYDNHGGSSTTVIPFSVTHYRGWFAW